MPAGSPDHGTDNFLYSRLKSSVRENVWPAIPVAVPATIVAIEAQLDHSQWLDAETLGQRQYEQFDCLLRYAARKVPYYREVLQGLPGLLDQPAGPDTLRSLPLLARADVYSHGERLRAEALPSKEHAPLNKVQTSGSTGMPITAYGTAVTRLFWQAITLRDHLWHGRDMSKKIVSIRPEIGMDRKSAELQGWGGVLDQLFRTGPAAVMNSGTPIEEQAEWLIRQQPAYVLSLPTNLKELARYFAATGKSLPGLEEIRTYGEVSDDEVRRLCRDTWGVPVHDMYSCQEAGYIALECPEYGNYHVQSECLIVEILDEKGEPCAPGETGRVAVTTLQNYAMPLIRYLVGDYAVAGEPCPCGRGLPVMGKILGRERNMVTLPDGSSHYPSFPAEAWMHIAPIRQIRLVQKTLHDIEAHLVTGRELTGQEKETFIKVMQERLKYPFNITLAFHDVIERSSSGKYEDFVSELTGTGDTD